jgi:hypothetical protein
MIDLSELAREQADRVRAYVRLAPVTEVVAAGRRRRRRRAALAALAAVACVAAASVLFAAWPAHTPPSGVSAAQTIRLDGGALTIEPVDGVTPVYDEAYALAAAAQVIWPVLGPPTRIVLARVRSNLEPKPSSFDGTVIQTSWSLAWVLLSTERPASMCVAGPAIPGATPAGPLGTAAVLVDATSGLASAYLPNHATCLGWTRPQLEPAEAMYSVPFQVDAQGRFTVQLPPCGIPFGANQGPVRVEDQIVPLASGAVQYAAAVRIGPCHASATTYRVKPPDVKAPYGHAPIGQMRRTSEGVVVDP